MIITIGTIIKDAQGNEYSLEERIGSGGFGDVYKAFSKHNNGFVAVKFLQNTFDNDDAILSFQKEMNQSLLVDSEHVEKYYYIHNGSDYPSYPPYIIMEYTDGGTLRDLLINQNGKQFDLDTLMNMFLQLADGMKCVSQYLVHRDIKPENILNFYGTLKITDFGLSKLCGESTKTMTFKNGGTMLYIAPEAWNNDKNTIQMDIYSMGIVFYELATLTYPYSLPKNQEYSAYRDMHLYETPINPTSLRRDLPTRIVSVILGMLEKPTQSRLNNWDEIINLLQSDTQPKNTISSIVSRAVALKNEKDLQWQTQKLEKEKMDESKKEHIKFAYSQYSNSVLSVVREFANQFNNEYLKQQKISIEEISPSGLVSRFSTKIRMPTGYYINIEGEVLFEENYSKKITTTFGQQRTVHYLPQCRRKDIVLWCQLKDHNEKGFNILLLKNDASIYGDWYILENKENPLSGIQDTVPFGFKISDLPRAIQRIDMYDIYNMNLISFTSERFLDFFTERV